ncbi:hypothetical protein [uncultured Flavobacterium sp.]|uniref:hypothetical protein n=1 Tax=uncultured Flavobacterium sp. TaxID=165435 RepID=UPI0030EB3AB6|tara:strand:- start:1575 stop:1751 length:177 start_codon:yes stop_codon:yes gene_type:complete
MATSVPVPIAIPISDCANAGASFIPSPALAVIGGFLIALALLLIVLPSLLMKFVSAEI